VTKQSSIEALRQQLTQIEDLTEEQLNGLLQRLESQKAKLAVEDRSIVDWGIGLIRAKSQEKEQLRQEMCSNLNSRYRECAFIKQLGWESLDLKRSEHRNRLYVSGWNLLEEIVKLSYQFQDERCLNYVDNFRGCLRHFCARKTAPLLSKKLIDQYVIQAKNYEINHRSTELKSYYRQLRKHLEE